MVRTRRRRPHTMRNGSLITALGVSWDSLRVLRASNDALGQGQAFHSSAWRSADVIYNGHFLGERQ